MQHHARWRSIWFCPIPGCQSSLSSKEGLVRHLQTRQHARGTELNLARRVAKQIANQNCFWPVSQTMADKLLRASKRIIRYVALYSMAGVAMESRLFRRGTELNLARRVAKQIANQNCFWPVSQTMADKLLRASKRIIRYVALYSMAGVAMESRLFRIHPSARDTPFIDACAAFLTPKMDLSQVVPSGCHLRQVAHPPGNQLAVQDRPSTSDYQEEEDTIDPSDMHMAVSAPVFQPYRGATGRAWMAQEYGLAVDTSSLLSS